MADLLQAPTSRGGSTEPAEVKEVPCHMWCEKWDLDAMDYPRDNMVRALAQVIVEKQEVTRVHIATQKESVWVQQETNQLLISQAAQD